MESRIMGVRFCTLDKRSMTGNSHRDSLIDDTARDVGGDSRDILLRVSSDHDIPAIHKLGDTAKTRHVVAFLELVDNSVERRLWKTPRGPPGVLQYQTLAWLRVQVILFRRSKHPCSASLQCHGLPDWESVCMVCVLSNLDLEARVACNGAKVVERRDSRIEAEFVGVHVAGGAANDSNKRFEVVVILKIVVI